MHAFELALFVVIVVLALALIGSIVRPYLRSRRSRQVDAQRDLPWDATADLEPRRGQRTFCPTCHGEYPAGLQYCPYDARELVPAHDPQARALAPALTCPTCARSFDGSKRFCPFDGEELVPITLARRPGDQAAGLATGPAAARAGFAAGQPPRRLPARCSRAAVGKICPHCSRRYESDATFCGRDGSELVTVN